MKYTANLVKAVLRAMQNHPLHTFWDCEIVTEIDDPNIAVVTCNTAENDGQTIGVHIVDNVVYCNLKKQNGDAKWFGLAQIDRMNRDTFMMWLGCKLSAMYADSMKNDLQIM